MGQQHLDFGTPASNDGEKARTAFPKIQANTTELFARAEALQNSIDGVQTQTAQLDARTGVLEEEVAGLTEGLTAAPIVILATGQSNMALTPSYVWSPPPNLKVWNWNGSTGSVGSAFVDPTASTIGAGVSFAAEVARSNPTRSVYLVNISISNIEISHWKVGASVPDVYADIRANVVPALADIGAARVDCLLWWQGESDAFAGSATYPADFETVMNRFKAETWFTEVTPVVVFGFNSSANGNASLGSFLATQQQTVNADIDNRKFVYPATLGASYWNVDTVHMTAPGYSLAGIMAANAFAGRAARGGIPGLTVSEAGEFSFTGFLSTRKDQDATTRLLVQNSHAGPNAISRMQLLSAAGHLLLDAQNSGLAYIASSTPSGLLIDGISLWARTGSGGTRNDAFKLDTSQNADFYNRVRTTKAQNAATIIEAINTDGGASAFARLRAQASNGQVWLEAQPGLAYLFSDLAAGLVADMPRFRLRTNGGSLRLDIDAAGNIVCGSAALATNATAGFLYVPGCAGTPAGVPTSFAGRVPIVVDTTNNKLYFFSNSAWRDAGP